ncbi:hypothetical protein [Caenimonas sedimenti]|uniref:hypothetical protein n=1 Tax=Caenimonas sedimenti TaxID=2596921 RepID=UPI00164522CD|nr:hypothetical protein [Caenimonas sedimenti]
MRAVTNADPPEEAPPAPPGSRTGEGSASVLPHLQRQQTDVPDDKLPDGEREREGPG